MPRRIKPKTRYELFKKVLLAWYYAQKDIMRILGSSYKAYEEKKLKEKYDEYLQLWEDLRL